jgi:hypothetical protein
LLAVQPLLEGKIMRPIFAATILLSTCLACLSAVAAEGADRPVKPADSKAAGEMIEKAPPGAGSPSGATQAPKDGSIPREVTRAPKDDYYPTTESGELAIDP